MRDRELYAQILGIRSPWSVTSVELQSAALQVVVNVRVDPAEALCCPECGDPAPRYDFRERRWRHLDTCQYRTVLSAEVPRVQCPSHGVHQVKVPWGEPHSRFTALFEALVIDWLREANLSAVSRLLSLTWKEVDGIMARAVIRGMARRRVQAPRRMGVDETSFQKRHEYVTVVTDLDKCRVLAIADDRESESLLKFYRSLTPNQRRRIATVAMDMHGPYIKATRESLSDADAKIVFDKFHVAKHLSDAVDQVRRKEHQELMAEGDDTLKGTKYLWLQNPVSMPEERWNSGFAELRRMNLRTARAWRIKEAAMWIWTLRDPQEIQAALKRWIGWAARSRLEPIRRVAATIKNHLCGVVNAIVTDATNAASESVNAKIQRVKWMACGFRSRVRFKLAIFFHCGGLDLYPASAGITHTIS